MRNHDIRFLGIARLGVLMAIGAAAPNVYAQNHDDPGVGRSLAGVQAIWVEPQGEFADFIEDGFGLGGYGVFNLDRGRIIGLRLEGTILLYGHERFSRPFSRTVPRVWVGVTTDNLIVSGFIGPQITLGRGLLRTYVHGGVGLSYFSTYSQVDDDIAFHTVASSTNYDDWATALTGGGGLYLALSRRVLIDLSAQYVYNGNVSYMREGGIYEETDGSLWYEIIESEANLWMWKLGVSFAIG